MKLIARRTFAHLSHLQRRAAATTILVVAGTTALFWLPKFFMPMPEEGFSELAFGSFAALVSAATTVTLIAMTQRIAGPTRIIANAIRRMMLGDYSARLALRKDDELTEIAVELEALRRDLVRQRRQRELLLGDIEAAFDEGDVQRARQLSLSLSELERGSARAPERTRRAG